jgi:hypothetical protein|tara:strand:+ start:503 stop:970 length:468 start_codon:yes stop_codon:yes gene_type:complete
LNTRYKIILGILGLIIYTTSFNILDDYYDEKSWIDENEKCKEEYTIVWTLPTRSDSIQWEETIEDIVLDMENQQERSDSLEEQLWKIEDGISDSIRKEIEKDYEKSDVDKLIDLFWVVFYLPNLIFIGIFGTVYAIFYLLFYSAKLWLERYFKGE